jgi:ubiquitin-like-conjugating enzyme ATG3
VYNVNEGVACPKRVEELEGEMGGEEEEDLDGFMLPAGGEKHQAQDLDIDPPTMDLDDIPDMDELEGFGTITAEDIAEAPSNILKTRTYDITITYDKYYQTPRVWLVGYDEYGMILGSEQV